MLSSPGAASPRGGYRRGRHLRFRSCAGRTKPDRSSSILKPTSPIGMRSRGDSRYIGFPRWRASIQVWMAAPRHPTFCLKTDEPPLCVIARPGIKLFRRDRISASDLLGAYPAGRDSPKDSHLSASRPPHIYICVRKTIRRLRIVGHVQFHRIGGEGLQLPHGARCFQSCRTSS